MQVSLCLPCEAFRSRWEGAREGEGGGDAKKLLAKKEKKALAAIFIFFSTA